MPIENKKTNEDLEGVTVNQALSSLVTCTLPLKDLQRVKLGVWKKMAKKLSLSKMSKEMKPLPP